MLHCPRLKKFVHHYWEGLINNSINDTCSPHRSYPHHTYTLSNYKIIAVSKTVMQYLISRLHGPSTIVRTEQGLNTAVAITGCIQKLKVVFHDFPGPFYLRFPGPLMSIFHVCAELFN